MEKKKTITMSCEDTLRFISLVESHACLWNRRDLRYRNKIAQEIAWTAVEHTMGVHKEHLKQKWRSLCSSYRHCKSVYSASQVAASSASTKKKTEWFAYQAMGKMLSNDSETVDLRAEVIVMCETPPPGPSGLNMEYQPPPPQPADGQLSLSQSTATRLSTPPSPNTPSHERARSFKRRWNEASAEYASERERILNVLRNDASRTDNLAETRTGKSRGALFGEALGKKLDTWSPERRDRMMLRLEIITLDEERNRFCEKYGAHSF